MGAGLRKAFPSSSPISSRTSGSDTPLAPHYSAFCAFTHTGICIFPELASRWLTIILVPDTVL